MNRNARTRRPVDQGNPVDWKSRTGPIGFSMNNDYLFRAVMQTDTEVFAMLLSSLLRTQCCADDIEILNPIELGKQMQEKDFVLDTKLKLRNDIVNVEMQLWLQSFWKERAMTYLCRIFDSLKVGEPYDRLKTAIHIGIIDFVLPDVRPELYAEYMLKNVKTGEVFSDKMRLNVLCLKHEKLATESDIENGLLFWVKYFIASTWEDLIMLANDNPVMEKPISAAVRLSEEDRIREMILLREEAIRVRRSELSVYAKAEKDLKEARTQIGALTKKLDSAEQERDSAVQERDSAVQERDSAVQERDSAVQQLDEANAEIRRLKELIAKSESYGNV